MRTTTNAEVADFFKDPAADQFFGASFTLKCDVLRAALRGEKLSDVAARHGVTRQAASKQARRASEIFGQIKVDCKPLIQ